MTASREGQLERYEKPWACLDDNSRVVMLSTHVRASVGVGGDRQAEPGVDLEEQGGSALRLARGWTNNAINLGNRTRQRSFEMLSALGNLRIGVSRVSQHL